MKDISIHSENYKTKCYKLPAMTKLQIENHDEATHCEYCKVEFSKDNTM